MNVIVMCSRCSQYKSYLLLIPLAGFVVIGAIVAFPLTYVTNSNVLIGACLLPFVMLIGGKPQINFGYLGLMLLFMSLAFLHHARIFYFFAMALYVLFVLESGVGKVEPLMLFLVAFMSPVFEQVAIILGFPIRLHLSSLAASILSTANINVIVSGNVMLLEGVTFTVDEACMGLHLLSISMLMGVFVLAHRFKAEKRTLSFGFLSAFFLIVFMLNVVSNLFRITLLVAFRIMPENSMHDAIGILCLVTYVAGPMFFLSGWMVRRFGRALSPLERNRSFTRWDKMIAIFLGVCIALLAFQIDEQRKHEEFAYTRVSFGTLQAQQIKGGVTKFSDREVLVYVKPIPEFFSGEHTPLICWKGSGYQFEGIRKVNISGREIYMGALVRADARLLTAWWYDNGEIITIDQIEWRMRMLKGEDGFCLVNVTAENEAALNRKLKDVFDNNLIKIEG